MNFRLYLKELQNHDWSYYHSDDHSVYTKGLDNARYLHRLAMSHPVADRMHKAFTKHWDERINGTPITECPPLPSIRDVESWLLDSEIKIAA